MNLTPERTMKLMALVDGELEGTERDEVLSWLESDDEAAAFVNDAVALGDYIRLGEEGSERAKAVAAFDVADAVVARLGRDEPVAGREPPSIVSIDAARARGSSGAAAGGEAAPIGGDRRSTARGNGTRTNAVRPPWKVGAGVAAVFALAAAVLLFARTKEADAPLARFAADSTEPVSAGPGVDVNLIETPGQTVSVFYLPSETTLTTSVLVWVNETGDK